MALKGQVSAPIRLALNAVAVDASTTLVNAVNGQAIVVQSLFVSANAAGTFTFKTNATNITGPMPIAANAPTFAYSPDGLFATAVGEPLVVTTSASTRLEGVMQYVLVNDP